MSSRRWLTGDKVKRVFFTYNHMRFFPWNLIKIQIRTQTIINYDEEMSRKSAHFTMQCGIIGLNSENKVPFWIRKLKTVKNYFGNFFGLQ